MRGREDDEGEDGGVAGAPGTEVKVEDDGAAEGEGKREREKASAFKQTKYTYMYNVPMEHKII